jgi:hypothetical protein
MFGKLLWFVMWMMFLFAAAKKNTIIMFERASKTKMINDLEHVEQKFQQNEYKFIDLFL